MKKATEESKKDSSLDLIAGELEQVLVRHEGCLNPEDVVEFAKNPKTALHSRFTWDNSEAARLYRLEQARHIIRVMVTTISGKNDKPEVVRLYVSLPEDRGEGGYRTIVNVLSDNEYRKKMLEEAFKEFSYFRQKYALLTELSSVFEAMEKVRHRKK
jgi:hypothetical protein